MQHFGLLSPAFAAELLRAFADQRLAPRIKLTLSKPLIDSAVNVNLRLRAARGFFTLLQ
jgi:hypothetical protein